ncbi:MAG: hypothetical protein J2P19_27365 [Pseudonocardia sp.]|nr:hypothetical protein [Pseudonocardia sp.]
MHRSYSHRRYIYDPSPISPPLGWSTQGWPIGVQLMSGLADEAVLLALAGDLERARPWADRAPSISAG